MAEALRQALGDAILARAVRQAARDLEVATERAHDAGLRVDLSVDASEVDLASMGSQGPRITKQITTITPSVFRPI